MLPWDARILEWPFVDMVENKTPICCEDWRRKSPDPQWQGGAAEPIPTDAHPGLLI
jgi:hypothetical protein